MWFMTLCFATFLLFLLFILFSYDFLFYLISYCYYYLDAYLHSKGMDLGPCRGGEDLDGVEEGETIIRMYCPKSILFIKILNQKLKEISSTVSINSRSNW